MNVCAPFTHLWVANPHSSKKKKNCCVFVILPKTSCVILPRVNFLKDQRIPWKRKGAQPQL
uniref:Uncharacterized protein n=1 Tax=Anguilla anguilla TaxID=7936 RepID=A0A0E9WSG5_ANGAN